VAVLPFESLSANKKDTYFADGVQDEILSNLAGVSQLRVISRTSVMTFRPGDNRNLRSIAELLGVANVVEGTVRRDGNHVRITIRLVDARADKTLWSDTYDRSMTDIFGIQSDIAQKVAARLTAQLSPKEQKELQENRTKDVEAYDLYLRAKEMIFVQDLDAQLEPGDERERLLSAIRLLEEATKKDSQFALAFCQMAKANDALYWSKIDQTPQRRALADLASNEALRLRPDLAEVRVGAAWHHFVYRDDERALEELAGVRRSLANSAEALLLKAFIARRQGRWDEALNGIRRALSLEARNQVILGALFDSDYWLRRYREVEQILDRLIELAPDKPSLKAYKASVAFEERADLAGYRTLMEKLPSSSRNSLWITSLRFQNAVLAREWKDAKKILSDSPYSELYFSFSPYSWANSLVPRGCHEIWLAALQRGSPTMEARFESARDQLRQKAEAQPDDAGLISALGLIDAALGRKQEAIQEARRAAEMLSISKDAVEGPPLVFRLALVYAWTNEPDLAFQELAISVKAPAGVHYGELKLDPAWDPIRKDPRFEKLLAQLAPSHSLQKTTSTASRVRTRRPPARRGPKKISVARLPVTGSDVFGREEDIAFLDEAWANQRVNIVTIIAWAGVGKSTLVNHWLGRMAADHYRSAEVVFGWSFYRQGTSGGTSSADEFLDAALRWFGDPDAGLGTAWEKGERLAKLVGHRRTLLVLDGLEPLQNPPGPQEGRLHEPALQALLRELAAFNTGLCVITTRLSVADIADHERTSARRRDLDQLSGDAGAKLLRALGVKGDEAELRRASDEFRGHSLALTLLGSYLTDAYDGDIHFRNEVSGHLANDVRQGVHARKVMESYQTWFGDGPELSILRMLGLFDRPADEKVVEALLKRPAIGGLTESLTDLSPTELRTVLARLRRARLLAGEDPHNSGQLDAHPLVREYFGEQLRSQRTEAWKECNERLYQYYRTLAPQLPNDFREMEPLFLAVICGCNAGLFREALHEVYIPRIQRGDACFAAKVLGARGALLSVLAHFFEDGRWGSHVGIGVEGQSLTVEDQFFILIQAGSYLNATRGYAAPEVRICYERAESLCNSLDRPLFLYAALMGQWRHSNTVGKLSEALQIAKRLHSLAQEHDEPALLMGGFHALACTLYFLGEFVSARQYAMRAIQTWRSQGVQPPVEEVDVPITSTLSFAAISEWHLGEISSCRATIAEAISLAKQLNDMHGLVVDLVWAAFLEYCERNPSEMERLASEVIELSTRHHFAHYMAVGTILRGWARSASGNTTEGIACIEDGIRDFRAIGAITGLADKLRMKAEALYLADRTFEAFEALREAEAILERTGEGHWRAEHHRLHGVLLAAIGADKTQVEASFCEAIRIAKEQKSVSLEKRAKQPTRNTAAKKRACQEDVDSDYLFGNFLQRAAFRSKDKASLTDSFRSPPRQH
jgi:TolB-like protein